MGLDTLEVLPFEVGVIVTHKNGLPAVELRRLTTDSEIVKQLISATWHGQTIIIRPVFKDNLRSVASLIEKGIVYRNPQDQQLYFTF